MNKKNLLGAMARHNVKQKQIAEVLDLSSDKVSKALNGVRKFTAEEVGKLDTFFASLEKPDAEGSYLEVQVMPSYAGMGGGGNGEGEILTAKVSRKLIEDELRGTPNDFELIDVRGDSMEPDFRHGDQILVDLRDRNPLQPGAFVLWDDDGYVLKLVERVPSKRGWYRIFSTNDKYADYEVEESATTIRGRPVWFARRL